MTTDFDFFLRDKNAKNQLFFGQRHGGILSTVW